MGRTRRYILSTFAKTYLLVFTPFFLVVSLVYIIQLSVLSSKVNMGASDLLQLFAYMLPEIFFYTVPVSFIAALANTFGYLSSENELVALSSLGYTPKRILSFILPTLILFTLLLLTISVLLYPQMRQKFNEFKRHKIAEATLKIIPNKLSQSFGNYHVFVQHKDNNDTYKDVILYYQGKNGSYQLFIAKRGKIENNGKRFSLILYDGIGETSNPKKIESLQYKQLNLYQYPHNTYSVIDTSIEYWEKAKEDRGRRGELLYLLFISLSLLLSFGIVASMTFYNPRHQRSLTIGVSFILIFIIYFTAIILKKYSSFTIFVIASLILATTSIILVQKKLLRQF